MSLSPGTRLGHYDVTDLLGEGGMGQVCCWARAWQTDPPGADERRALNGKSRQTGGTIDDSRPPSTLNPRVDRELERIVPGGHEHYMTAIW